MWANTMHLTHRPASVSLWRGLQECSSDGPWARRGASVEALENGSPDPGGSKNRSWQAVVFSRQGIVRQCLTHKSQGTSAPGRPPSKDRRELAKCLCLCLDSSTLKEKTRSSLRALSSFVGLARFDVEKQSTQPSPRVLYDITCMYILHIIQNIMYVCLRCMCMYVYIYIYIYTCIYTSLSLSLYIYIYICMYVYIYIYIYTHLFEEVPRNLSPQPAAFNTAAAAALDALPKGRWRPRAPGGAPWLGKGRGKQDQALERSPRLSYGLVGCSHRVVYYIFRTPGPGRHFLSWTRRHRFLPGPR